MTVSIAELRALPYALAFEAPVITGRGRFTHRRGWLLRVLDTDGRVGWGDAAPWPGFGSCDELVSVQMGGITDGRLVGTSLEGLSTIATDVARRKLAPEVAHALELALLDLLGQRQGMTLAALLGGEQAGGHADTHTLVLGEPDPQSLWLKVKAGSGPLEDLEERLARYVARAHSEATIRVDVGGAWSVDDAKKAIPRLARFSVSTIEQPIAVGQLHQLAELRAVANDHGLALAADEDVTDRGALEALLSANAVDEVVLKPMFVGGLLTARRLARIAADRGCRATVTNALESAIGRAGARHLAAGIAGVHGLSDALAEDVATLPCRRANRVVLPPGFGLGLRPVTGDEPTAVVNAASSPSNAASIPDPIRSSTIARPHHPAIVADDATLTYRELSGDTAVRTHALRAQGVRPGTRVALSGPPDASWVAWLHAVGAVGAVAVPLPTRGPADELARTATAALAQVRINTAESVPTGEMAPPSASADERFWPLDEPRLLVCSSGTTGAPKPNLLTTLQLMTSAFGSAVRLGHDPEDRWLCCLPLHHVGGLSILFRCAFYGTTVVLHERFDADRVARALDDGDATLVSLVPTMLSRVLDAREKRWGPNGSTRPFPVSLRAILLGGARPSDALLARCREVGAPIALTWGMTEAASQVATSHVGDTALVPHSFARVESRDGRLIVTGPVVSGDELVTSDSGRTDADGQVIIAGRADDVIISGGEKVAPAEIERVLRDHPDIDDAAVVALTSLEWGRRPFAVVQSQQSLTTANLQRWCRQHLAPFKVPDGFICLPALPRAELGKVSLREVRSMLDARFPETRLISTREATQP